MICVGILNRVGCVDCGGESDNLASENLVPSTDIADEGCETG